MISKPFTYGMTKDRFCAKIVSAASHTAVEAIAAYMRTVARVIG